MYWHQTHFVLMYLVVVSAANVMEVEATLRSGSQLIAEDQGWGPGCIKLVAVLFSVGREHSLSDAQDRSAHVLRPIKKPAACVC